MNDKITIRINSLLLLLLMLVLGGGNAWAQTDYSGTYYIKSESANKQTSTGDYYLCPTESWIYYKATNDFQEANNGQPFLTTYCKTSEDAAKYKWILEKHTVDEHDYYSFRYATDYNSQKRYLSFNGKIGNAGQDRIRLHLEIKDTPGENELFEFLSYKTSPYLVIKPKLNDVVNNQEVPKYLVVNGGNKDSYKGESGKGDGPSNKYKNTAGIIGIYNDIEDPNAPFSLEEIIDRPTFTSTNSQIVISHPEGNNATIYYTTNGTNPTTTNYAGTGTAPHQIDMPKNAVTIKAIAVIDNLPSCISSIRVVPNATVTLGASTFTYNGSEQKPTVTVKDGNTTISTDEYTVGYSNNTNAGDATVTINNATGGSYIVYGSTSFTISPKTLTITAKQKSITYGDAPTNDGVLYSGFVSGEDKSVLSGTLAYTYNYEQYGDVGNTYTITPGGLTGANYNISFVAGTLTVNPREVGLTWSETTSFVYDGEEHVPTATATGLVNGDAVTVNVTGKQTSAGNYTATASSLTGEKAGNYKLPDANTQEFSITKVGLTVSANNNTITYGDAPAGNGVTYEGFVEGDDESKLGGTLGYDYSYTQYGDVGNTYTITPKGLTSSNYNISYVDGTLTVTPKALTITADAKEKAYGDDDPALTYTFEGLVGSDAITGALSREAGENVGTYAINQNTVTAGTNYNISYTGANLTINKKALTVTANPKTIIYGNGPTNNGVTYSGFAPGEDKSVLSGTLTYTYNYAKYDDVGNTYTITPGGLTGSNYNISFVAGTLTVNPREVGLTWSETTSFVYDGSAHAPTATATGLVNGDAVTVTVTGKQTSAGNYTATASSLTGDKAGNYKLPDANTQEFSITKVGLTITANNNTITYGDAPSGNGVTYEGFVNSETASVLGGTLGYDYSYTKFGNVGDYTITPKDLTSNNYDISFVAGTLTVGQKEVGISWSTTTTFPYDGSAHAPTATATGLVNSDAITVTVTGAQTNAGNYTATASALAGVKAGNYKLPAANTRSFTISRKSLGEGTLAEGYILDFGEGNTILLTDDAIGSALAIGTDYSVSDDSDPSDKYSKRTVIGIGNYTGTFDVRNVVISFTTDTEQEEWSATFVAEDTEGFNLELGLALPEGVSAFIISDIRGDWAIPEPLNYIPKGVPVLLVAHKPICGFVPTKAENGDVTPIPITDDQKSYNKLKEVTAESAHFKSKQIYVLYKNEFVLIKEGDLGRGKVYMENPNYVTPSSPAPASLHIAWGNVTGIEEVRSKKEDGRSERWYTLDGRRLSGKPTAKGVYIVGGKKIVVK